MERDRMLHLIAHLYVNEGMAEFRAKVLRKIELFLSREAVSEQA